MWLEPPPLLPVSSGGCAVRTASLRPQPRLRSGPRGPPPSPGDSLRRGSRTSCLGQWGTPARPRPVSAADKSASCEQVSCKRPRIAEFPTLFPFAVWCPLSSLEASHPSWAPEPGARLFIPEGGLCGAPVLPPKCLRANTSCGQDRP